jgi:hypothetical protein
MEVDSDKESDEEIESEAEDNFYVELEATIDRAIKENHSLEIAALELNTLKMAYDGTFDDIRTVVTPRVVQLLGESKDLGFIKKVRFSVLCNELLTQAERRLLSNGDLSFPNSRLVQLTRCKYWIW